VPITMTNSYALRAGVNAPNAGQFAAGVIGAGQGQARFDETMERPASAPANHLMTELFAARAG